MLPRRFQLRFLHLFFRHLWLNLLPVFIMSIAGVVFLLQPVYISYASIYIQRNTLLDVLVAVRIRDEPFSGVQLLTPAEAVATEFNELSQTDAFAYAVITNSDLRDELNGSSSQVRRVLRLYRESLSIDVEGDNLVRVSIEAETPTLAYQFASATIDAYRLWKVSKDVQDSTIAQTFFEEILIDYSVALEAAQQELGSYLERYPEPAVGVRPVEEEFQITRLQSNVALAEQRLKDILDKSESARLALAQTERDVDQTYKIVDPPLMPPDAEPFYTQALLALVFPVVGIFLSIGLVLGLCVSDQSLLNRVEVREELDLPVLAQIPAASRAVSRKQRSRQAALPPGADESLPDPVRA